MTEMEQEKKWKGYIKREAKWKNVFKYAKIILSGTGIFIDAYDIFIIGVVLPIMNFLYPQNQTDARLVSSAVLIGAVAGQLGFGLVADVIGRRIAFVLTMSLVIVGAIASTLVFDYNDNGVIYGLLFITRFILGVGIGGEYPLAASIASEATEANSQQKHRGMQVSAVFSMQGFGNFAAPLAALFLLLATHDLDVVWRLALGLGAVPGILILPFRILMNETESFKTHGKEPEGTKKNIFKRLGKRARLIAKHWRNIVGTAGNWFLFDVLFYANSLFSPSLLVTLGFSGGDTPWEKSINAVKFQLVLAACAIPGYWCSVALIDVLGRRFIQIQGYVMLALLYVFIGTFYNDIIQHAGLFLFLYGATFFFSNFGPNVTTFVLPAEVFPTSLRATLHGFAAASGKVGAVVGVWGLQELVKKQGQAVTFNICGTIAILGLFLTIYFTPETMGKNLFEETRLDGAIEEPGVPPEKFEDEDENDTETASESL